MSSATVSSKSNVTSASRAAARRLLSRWQRLNQLQRDVFAQMAKVESELGQHINLQAHTEVGRIRGSFLDVCMDSNEYPADADEWLATAISAAGL
jgi:hypothetical protein